jgi:hypothetical protein
VIGNCLKFRNEPFSDVEIHNKLEQIAHKKEISIQEASYYVFTDSVSNKAYSSEGVNIKVLFKNGDVADITNASDQYNISALAKPVTKYFLCSPKFI